MDPHAIPCPFVHADGRQCTGVIRQAIAYGPTSGRNYVNRRNVRKYRFWCSDPHDHVGAVPSTLGKEWMEFSPGYLAPEIEHRLWTGGFLGYEIIKLPRGDPEITPPTREQSCGSPTGRTPTSSMPR